MAISAHAELRLPSCLRQILYGNATPAATAPRFPEDRGPELAADYAAAFAAAGIAPTEAVAKGDALAQRLEDVLKEAATDSKSVPSLIAALASGSLASPLGHGPYRELPRLEPDMLSTWVNDAASLDRATEQMARQGHLFPGKIRLPVLWMWRNDALYEATPGDGNDPSVYSAQLLLLVEEHLHLVQRLREYGGKTGTGWSVSLWARQSGVTFAVDREADVYAWMLERWGTRVPGIFRTAYPSRRHVPLP